MKTFPTRFARAYDLIADKLARVEEELLLHFRSPIPTIDRIGSYLASGGGKRIVVPIVIQLALSPVMLWPRMTSTEKISLGR